MNFEIGEEVICIKNHSQGCVLVGEEYIVESARTCSCGLDKIMVITNRTSGYRASRCTRCGHRRLDTGWFDSILFRRKATEYNSAHDEIIEKYPLTEEVPDTPIKEPQL